MCSSDLGVCDGGTLEVEWPEGGHVRQVGDVEIVFEGEWLADGVEPYDGEP